MKRARGFSLIEVLIAVTILAVGLLGMAALQAVSVRTAQSAQFRTQATALTAFMLDAMRANRSAVLRGEYFARYAAADCSASEPAGGSGSRASRDIAVWRRQIACSLPEGRGEIRFPGDNKVVVAIDWKDARWAKDGATGAEFTVESAL